jgi:hypothetical protein
VIATVILAVDADGLLEIAPDIGSEPALVSHTSPSHGSAQSYVPSTGWSLSSP